MAGQHQCGSIHQSNGRYKIINPCRSSSRPMEVGSIKKHHSTSSTHCRGGEYLGRRDVQIDSTRSQLNQEVFKKIECLWGPWWTTQSWFPRILLMCMDHPHILPMREDLLLPTTNAGIPESRVPVQLVAWLISGDSSKVRMFLEEQESSSQQLGGNPPTKIMNQPGKNRRVFVSQGKLIQFLPLLIEVILSFLASEFHQGHQYRSLNILYRSAFTPR